MYRLIEFIIYCICSCEARFLKGMCSYVEWLLMLLYLVNKVGVDLIYDLFNIYFFRLIKTHRLQY